MKITTVEKANEKLQIRMYPVGDLVLGPDQLRAMTRGGGMGGRGGAQGGGMAGGQGGGMAGGMGGGGVNVGGGMFSVPTETFSTQAKSPADNNGSSFNNDSVRTSKKKLTSAR